MFELMVCGLFGDEVDDTRGEGNLDDEGVLLSSLLLTETKFN